MRVADGFKIVMDAKRLKGLAESTLHGYQDHIDLYLVPHLGHIALRDLRASHLEGMYNAILAGNKAKIAAGRRTVSQATLHSIHRTARALLSVLRKRRLIKFNPASDVELAMPPTPEVLAWSGAQLGRFLDYCESQNDPLSVAFAVMACLGLRRGELVGLRWEYIDLADGTVTIPSQQGATIVTVGGKARRSKPKTRQSARTGVLDKETVEALRRWHVRQSTQKLTMGPGWTETPLVFTQADGAAWHPNLMSSRFTTLSRHAGLPRIPLKNLRHSSANIGLESGETLKEVSERLDHSNINITAMTYTKVTVAKAAEVAERRAAAVPRTVRAHQGAHQPGVGVPQQQPPTQRRRSWGWT
ncbi:site-specific integrase [Frankia sp. Cppng1_Ct_nod]|uniref:site-specific integrase n=1 Tax=Frankia sp. Cppng1_Ct_nod TaxID=2897162 RepID=UPI0020241EC4|nr:site-specific integrase [Frankia sp. Cppng1_Ct_nod]